MRVDILQFLLFSQNCKI